MSLNKTSQSANQSLGSGLGGGTFQGNISPWRERERERNAAANDSRREPDRVPNSPSWPDRRTSDRDVRPRDSAVPSARELAPQSPWHDDRASDRDRDRAWSDRGSTKESSLRLPVDSRRPG